MNSPCSPSSAVVRYGGWTSCRVSRRLVILADEVEYGQIRIYPALQAAGDSNLNVGFLRCGKGSDPAVDDIFHLHPIPYHRHALPIPV
jgi:hypothetical protein